jgi:predicted dehydrogenase
LDKVKVGIVGAGFAAKFHIECYKKVYGLPLEVLGVTSLTPTRRDKLARDYGIKSYESVEDLCRNVDVLDICVPPYSHEEIAVTALNSGSHVIIEKPLTGYFGGGSKDFVGDKSPKQEMLREVLASADRIASAAKKSGKKVMYAENWIYAPSVQKELEILRSTRGQILWMIGEESHSGSHSEAYGTWSKSGGGSMIGKGCHPLSAIMFLKAQEGVMKNGTPIRASSVSANVHEITRLSSFEDQKFLRTSYVDVEDYAQMHLTFSDGTVADVFSSELVLGGTHSWLEVFANNHRTRCRISPVEGLSTYSPKEELMNEVYVMEKIGTKQGWTSPTLDEMWLNGYYQEIQDFAECAFFDREPLSNLDLARDCMATIYSGYLSAELEGKNVRILR